jgi:predicted glycoside hydrolase/deacetylase ChbG (UPF0249 family)
MIPLVVCADDYGLAPGVGTAIRALIEAGRLSATSCMTGTEAWPSEAPLLKPLLDRADVGLHFTLTDHEPLGPMPVLAPEGRFPSLGTLVKMGLLGRLDGAEIAAELDRQLDAFEAALGRPPAHVDGHHHVHGLPGVGNAVLAVFRRRLKGTGAYLRLSHEPPLSVLARGAAWRRAMAISLFSAPFARRVRAEGLPANRRFVGVRDFTPAEDYGALVAAFLKDLKPGTLMMCHPGLVDESLKGLDSVTDLREREYRFLAGDGFAAVLERAGARVARFDGN